MSVTNVVTSAANGRVNLSFSFSNPSNDFLEVTLSWGNDNLQWTLHGNNTVSATAGEVHLQTKTDIQHAFTVNGNLVASNDYTANIMLFGVFTQSNVINFSASSPVSNFGSIPTTVLVQLQYLDASSSPNVRMTAFVARIGGAVYTNLQPATNATLANPHCFLRGTLLRLADSSDKAVEDIKIGDTLATIEGPSIVIKTGAWMCSAAEPVYKMAASQNGAQHDLFVSKWHKINLADGSRVAAYKALPVASSAELQERQENGGLQFFHAQVANGADVIAEGYVVQSWDGEM